MKKLKFLLLILGMVFLTSCSTLYPVTSDVVVDVNFRTYDYNRINYLYLNHYDYFYNTRYINQYGVSCYLYQHPYFVRYQTDYYRRNHRHIPHHSRYVNVNSHRDQVITHNNSTRRNVSTVRSKYVQPRRTVTNNNQSVVRRTNTTVNRTPTRTSTVRRQSTYKPPQRTSVRTQTGTTVRQPVHNQVRRNTQTTTNRRRN